MTKEDVMKEFRIKEHAVKVVHVRERDHRGRKKPNGGFTVATVATRAHGIVNGIAKCSELDKFNNIRGASMALGRATRRIWDLKGGKPRKHHGDSKTSK